MTDKLKSLQIDPEQKRRPQGSLWAIFAGVFVIVAVAVYFAWPRASDKQRIVNGTRPATNSVHTAEPASAVNTPAAVPGDVLLTVSGYIINRARIELSPRFLGVVKWIGVKKGDAVTKGQTVVLLDDAEYQARLHEAEGHVANARVALEKAGLDYERIKQLIKTDIESKQREDDARLQVESARAAVLEAEGAKEAQALRAEGFATALAAISAQAKDIDTNTMALQYLDALKQVGSSASTKFIIPMELLTMAQQFSKNLTANGSSGTNGSDTPSA